MLPLNFKGCLGSTMGMSAGCVEILLKDKTLLTRQVDIPKGDPRDPMETDDISAKIKLFARNTNDKKDDKKINVITESILNLERIDNIRDLATSI